MSAQFRETLLYHTAPWPHFLEASALSEGAKLDFSEDYVLSEATANAISQSQRNSWGVCPGRYPKSMTVKTSGVSSISAGESA